MPSECNVETLCLLNAFLNKVLFKIISRDIIPAERISRLDKGDVRKTSILPVGEFNLDARFSFHVSETRLFIVNIFS